MRRGNFGNRCKDRYDRNRCTRTPEPAELLDRREYGYSSRNYEIGQNSNFGTPSDLSANCLGRNPQVQLFPSPITPGSVQNLFSFGGTAGNSESGGNSRDRNSGYPNFQFLVTPGQHPSIPNPFSASGVSSLRNFQMLASGSVHSGIWHV